MHFQLTQSLKDNNLNNLKKKMKSDIVFKILFIYHIIMLICFSSPKS